MIKTKKKFTTQQRLSRLERVVSQNYFLNIEIQKEIKMIKDALNRNQIKLSGDEEE